MSDMTTPLFDFSPFVGQSEAYVERIKAFAAGPIFRSATVEELVLEGNDHYRRPLRPEDFDFLKFREPVRARTVSRLPSLASHRTLISLYELSRARPPESDIERAAFEDFASERNRQFARELSPFLEAYAFQYLGNGLSQPNGVTPTDPERLREIYAAEHDFWARQFERLIAEDYLQEGLCFILVQRWCLASSMREVLSGALARGDFDAWPQGVVPDLDGRLMDDGQFERIARMSGIECRRHAYWQFYLPTSLARCNLLYAMERREASAPLLWGGLYAAEAQWLAFEAAIVKVCPHMVGDVGLNTLQTLLDDLTQRFEEAVRHVEHEYDDTGLMQLGQGVTVSARLAERARWDLDEQLKWLSAIDSYCIHARDISRRIEAECPDIDRETFVEPRDMCSTTHVHNDHRLVTIEEGVMHFWGNVGMRLEMRKGDMVLIPDGRLHGSTVLSPECTYHQPIIPDAWVQALTAQTAEQAA